MAEAYATDTNGNGTIEEDEFLKGDVAVLKCICGDPQSHSAETVGEAEWGSTGGRPAHLLHQPSRVRHHRHRLDRRRSPG